MDTVPAPLNTLFELIRAHFNANELQDLCFQLNIDYADLPGETRQDKTRELVSYGERHGLVPELIEKFTALRPRISLPPQIKTYMESIVRLYRPQWLQVHGFEIDPFEPGAFKAETDPLFDLPGMPAFVEVPGMSQLVGTPTSPGYRFVFAPSGGGKTSLRRRLFDQFAEDLLQWYPLKEKRLILPVEYIVHDYSLQEANAEAHLRRIARLIARDGQSILIERAAHLTSADFQLDLDQPLADLLQNLAEAVTKWGLDAVCVLVDNLNRQPGSPEQNWAFIESLAVRTSDILAVDGFMFKFFCPLEFLPLARSRLPGEFLYEIQWEKEQVRQLLEQRLTACAPPQQTIIPGMSINPFDGLFADPRIKAQLAAFGQAHGTPTKMWQLGHYLLEEHFASTSDRRKPISTLIRYEALDKALSRLTESEKTIIPKAGHPTPSPYGISSAIDDKTTIPLLIDVLERLISTLPRYSRTETDDKSSSTHTVPPAVDDKTTATLEKILAILENCCSSEEREYNRLLSLIESTHKVVFETSLGLNSAIEKLFSHMDKQDNPFQQSSSQNATKQNEETGQAIDARAVQQTDTLQIKECIEQVDDLLSKAELQEACEIIKELDRGSGIRFLNRLTRIKQAERDGTISREIINAEYNTLVRDMQQWCTDFLKENST